MRRSVVIAGIVAVSMAVLPSAAFADQRPGTTDPAQAADCRPAGVAPGGGSGTGDPATGGDRPGAAPGTPGGGGEKPDGDEPSGRGAAGDKPESDKADGDKPADKSGGDKSGGESGGQPAPSGGDTPAEKGGGSGPAAGEGLLDDDPPAGDDSGGDTSPGDGSGGDKSGDDKSGGDKSGGDKSGDDKSGGDKSGGDKSGGDKSGEDKSAGDGSGGDQSGDESGEDKSTGDGSGGDKSSDDKPNGDQPAEDKAAGDKPAGEKPSADEPSGDAPAGARPAGAGAPGEPDPCAAPAAPADPAAPAGAATSAAVINKWGQPNRVDDFDGGLGDWSLYDGEGHAGNGRRSPDAASTKDGLLTINGDADGTTAGMAWNPGQKYGRWEGRVKAPASDPSYNALLLLWPDAENFPVGGEVDFMEMSDHTRQSTDMFLHYGEDNSQVQGKVDIDATQWHNWAVEWTPQKVTAFVDGKEWWSTTDTSILPPGPMHLCIQLDWFPDNGKSGVKPSEMQVDWVRQYPLPESEQQDGGGDTKKDDKGSEGLLEGIGGALDHLTRRTEGAPDPVGSAQRGPSRT